MTPAGRSAVGSGGRSREGPARSEGADREPRRLPQEGIENRVEVAFFSFTRASPAGDDEPYLTWHQLDHMPEQYRIPGLVLGQRWTSTPACRETRAVGVDGWSSVEHVVCYLMGAPVDQTVDDFLALGQELTDVGRYPVAMPSQYRGALRLRQAFAAPRVLVSDVVVPFRPHHGVYLVVDEPREPAGSQREEAQGGEVQGGEVQGDDVQGDEVQRDKVQRDKAQRDELRPEDGGERVLERVLPDRLMAELLEAPGVAGVWTFSTADDLRRGMFTPGRLRATVCYLDDDPAGVAGRLGDLVMQNQEETTRVLLAGPFESIVRWEWARGRDRGVHA